MSKCSSSNWNRYIEGFCMWNVCFDKNWLSPNITNLVLMSWYSLTPNILSYGIPLLHPFPKWPLYPIPLLHIYVSLCPTPFRQITLLCTKWSPFVIYYSNSFRLSPFNPAITSNGPLFVPDHSPKCHPPTSQGAQWSRVSRLLEWIFTLRSQYWHIFRP